MELTQEFREKLIQLQRYDANFLRESEKALKGHLETQLRRLEKIKNQEKEMRVKYYDTELLVTCLFYHQKLAQDFAKLQIQHEQSKRIKI